MYIKLDVDFIYYFISPEVKNIKKKHGLHE
jgi:hypothetical protein